ncbi:MerR family transcriptional regulator/heat shock protein HspR [Nocardiopsis arvandica]|uniref:MerR family transcriptional regulator/heat shock protein HspR n=1 Tax=Nocardiopsis sinuspersici TaxID=501010 RepID=A0A7Y9XDQ8_9ACTN|nr:MerR family transcriptional regulator [Nocardiopsis sinuspersici]NYH53783.1 MerR family transcriptional regulator/heat shock protein HspR [Nocardiopsis sinuspersici]
MTEPGSGSARGLYTISVAAELAGIAPQSLRSYEERGLVAPARTDGGTRMYSDDDIARLRRVAELAAQGVNLAGIGRILDLEDENTRLRGDSPAAGRE